MFAFLTRCWGSLWSNLKVLCSSWPRLRRLWLFQWFFACWVMDDPIPCPVETVRKPTRDETRQLESTYRIFLEACRHREQDFSRYLAILVPAIGLFLYAVIGFHEHNLSFHVLGWIALVSVSVLALGAYYCLSLGYNYRYLTFVLAKIENALGVRKYLLAGWPKDQKAFRSKVKHGCLWPPEVIAPFYHACLGGIILVTLATWYLPGSLARPEPQETITRVTGAVGSVVRSDRSENTRGETQSTTQPTTQVTTAMASVSEKGNTSSNSSQESVTTSRCQPSQSLMLFIIAEVVLFVLACWHVPRRFGWKFLRLCDAEDKVVWPRDLRLILPG